MDERDLSYIWGRREICQEAGGGKPNSILRCFPSFLSDNPHIYVSAIKREILFNEQLSP